MPTTDSPLTFRERTEARAGRLLGGLPPGAALRLSRRPQVRLDGQELDPGVQLLLAVREQQGRASLRPAGADAVQARAMVRREALQYAGRPTPVASVTDFDVDGAAGPLRARHYAPDAGLRTPAPLLVFLHGGGWVIGDLETHDEPCRVLCRYAGVHVLSVEYRLAPEQPAPVPAQDSIAALRWAREHAAALGADPERIAVGGDSAGGNLAAVACQQLRDAGERAPELQVLIYPGTDFAETTRSGELFGDGFFLTSADREWFTALYLPEGHDPRDPWLSPLRHPDLSGLPPAIVMTAAFDPLRDEGEAYAHALRAAGTPAVLHRAPGLIHGFINFTSVNRTSRDQTLMLAGMVRAALDAV